MKNHHSPEIGAIALPGVPLFPNNAIPLHIFEPRYKQMLADASSGDGLFAIGRSIAEESANLGEYIAPIGVMAKVVLQQTLDDGRSLLIVRGESIIRFTRWTSSLPYPIAEYEIIDRTPMVSTQPVTDLLKESFIASLEDTPKDQQDKIKQALESYDDLSAIIDFIAHISIHSEQLRSYFITETSDSDRASKLLLELEAK